MADIFREINRNIPGILERYKKIAVVGLSPKMHRPSHAVAAYLDNAGFEITPVNPGHTEILGKTCYSNLKEIPSPVEIVNIFRRSELVEAIVEDAIEVGAKVIWMQSGVFNEKAARLAVDAGLEVVMDTCIKIEHTYLS